MSVALADRPLGRTGLPVSRLGVGLAAVGRPGYITLGRAADLPERSPKALAARTAEILDAGRALGVRYVDVARSYGRAEEFVARWLDARAVPPDAVTIGSKWGYRYTGGWRVDAAVHEEKELSLARFEAQLAESRAILGDRLALYHVHSATAESGCLEDAALLRALVAGRRDGAYRAVGLTVTGPTAAAALQIARAARVDGAPVFDVVQATFNCLESSLADALAAAHADGMGVIAKEVYANGRLTPANRRPEDRDLIARLEATAAAADLEDASAAALGFVLAHPFVDVALSGAATPAQLATDVRMAARPPDPALRAALASLAEPPGRYWSTRGALPWT